MASRTELKRQQEAPCWQMGWAWPHAVHGKRILPGVAVGVSLQPPSCLSLQVARKLVILEGELERAEERAEVSEL